MAIAKTFQDLMVWQKSKDLAIRIFILTDKMKELTFKDQLNRACLSISNNIAEGFGRNSKREFKRFLNYSLGSAYEMLSMLFIFLEIKLIPNEAASDAINLLQEIIRMLIGLMIKIKTN